MKDLAKKVAVGLSAGALVAQSLVFPAFAEIEVIVSGNGADTENEVEVDSDNTTVVTQTNVANVQNDIDAEASTGENEANYNTGGDTSISTGNAQSAVEVSNTLNSNEANVECGGCPTDVIVKIEENGAYSENDVDLDLESEKFVTQSNEANVENDVEVEAETGENEGNYNTGGDVEISTGWAKAWAEVSTKANANVAHVGGGDDGALKLLIKGNGAKSENEIEADLDNTVVLDQTNFADIQNDVEVEAETGENEANKNTGGNVEISTGNAFAGAEVDTEANFNFAHVDCCELDGLLKIAGNGYDSDSDIDLDLESELFAEQNNEFYCGAHTYDLLSLFDGYKGKDCDVDAEAETGENEANKNTGHGEGDPVEVETGNAATEVEVENSANQNVFTTGDALSDHHPDWGHDLEGNWFWWLLSGHSS